jgi:hypothetical protein
MLEDQPLASVPPTGRRRYPTPQRRSLETTTTT